MRLAFLFYQPIVNNSVNNVKQNIMKKIILIVFTLILGTNMEAQSFGDILSASLDAIGQTQNINKKLNRDQQILLGAVSGLFRKTSAKEHDLNIANAGRTSVTLSGMSQGMQQFNGGILSRDLEGNIYFTLNGITTKISQAIVSRARKVVEGPMSKATLEGYDMEELTRKYNKEYKEWSVETIMVNKGEFAGDIIYPNADDSEIIKVKYYTIKKSGKEKVVNKGVLTEVPMYAFRRWFRLKASSKRKYIIHKKVNTNKIIAAFTYNWANDIAGDGFGIDDFRGIKRSFIEGEKLMMTVIYSSNNDNSKIELGIHNSKNGERVFQESSVADKGGGMVWRQDITTEKILPGIYDIIVKMKDSSGKVISSYREKFEILAKE